MHAILLTRRSRQTTPALRRRPVSVGSNGGTWFALDGVGVADCSDCRAKAVWGVTTR
jgi:hypothetical protein